MLHLFRKFINDINKKRRFDRNNIILQLSKTKAYKPFNIFSQEQLDNFVLSLANNENITDDDFDELWDIFFIGYDIDKMKYGNYYVGNVYWDKGSTLNIYVKDKIIIIQSNLNKNLYFILINKSIPQKLENALDDAARSVL
jgi:hypothetical protein